MKKKINRFLVLLIALVAQITFAQEGGTAASAQDTTGTGQKDGVPNELYQDAGDGTKSEQLEDVVVTAQGMKRSQRSTGYSTTVVNNDELTKTKNAGLMTGLQGKVAGLQVTSAGSTGTSSKVVIRGFSSFNGNQPLYVIDGIPINDDFQGKGTDRVDGFVGSFDFGNQSGDINSNDVESITILKGASATALYGSRAASGAIIITTKKAKEGKMQVVLDATVQASEVLRVPQTQNKFGQGWPYWDPAENGSWGPKLDGRTHQWGAWATEDYGDKPANYEVLEKPFSYAKDNLRNFYVTGLETNKNLSISSSTKTTGMVFSYGNVTASGVMPENADNFSRNSFSLRGNMKHEKFSLEASLNYVNKNVKKPIAGQSDDGASTFQELIQHATDIDFNSVKDYNNPNFNPDNYWTFYAENPYWVLANNTNTFKEDRVYGKLELGYDFTKWLKAVARLGGDFSNSMQQNSREKYSYAPGSWSEAGGKNPLFGSYEELSRNNGQIDATGFLQAKFDLNEDFKLSGFVGANANERTSSYLDAYLYGLSNPGWFSFDNGTEKPLTTSYVTKRRVVGVMGEADLNYKEFAFLSFSARNDWSSTLPTAANSYFYWGANASVVLSDMIPAIKDNSQILNFLKLRLAYGQTGSDASVYLTQQSYVPARFPLGFGDVNLPLGGVSGLTLSNTLANNKLKPEITTEAEFGFAANFLKNRINFDFSFYNKNTKDQIISSALSPESGFSLYSRNVGEIQNKGVEIVLGLVPIKTEDWQWTFNTTFTKNENTVLKLWDDVKEYRYTGAYDVDYMAVVGESLGQFRVPTPLLVTKEQAEAQGNPSLEGKAVVNSSGMYQIDPNTKATKGSSAPNFIMGFNTNVSWKSFTLSATADWRDGGYFYSYTSQLLAFSGNSTPTVYNDRQPFVLPNTVKKDASGNYVENDNPVTWSGTYNYYNNGQNKAQFTNWVLPKDYVKLREVAIYYDIPKTILGKYIEGIKLGVVGRNLLMWTAAENNFVDPDASNYGNDLTSEFGEFAAAPSTRTYGGSIQVRL